MNKLKEHPNQESNVEQKPHCSIASVSRSCSSLGSLPSVYSPGICEIGSTHRSFSEKVSFRISTWDTAPEPQTYVNALYARHRELPSSAMLFSYCGKIRSRPLAFRRGQTRFPTVLKANQRDRNWRRSRNTPELLMNYFFVLILVAKSRSFTFAARHPHTRASEIAFGPGAT